MIQLLITGANGQLGQCIKAAVQNLSGVNAVFVTKEQLDITSADKVDSFFRENNFHYCINTAAYTSVDKAESEKVNAFAINAEGAKNIANACKTSNCTLVHVSTDYVFDGTKTSPYIETDLTNPINVYGASKLKGEQYIQEICEKYFIFRTSWLYSEYGNNFLKTILKYAQAGKSLSITTEQTGTPTNANDLANAMLDVITQDSKAYGVYHFSNEGKATWYDFAAQILKFSQKLDTSKLAKTAHYPTFAARPANSVLDNSKFHKTFSIIPVSWKGSLKTLLNNSFINQ